MNCSECSLNFKDEDEYLIHIQTKHLRSLMINTDKGNNLVFSRTSPGQFICPVCFSICHGINDVFLHLFCKEPAVADIKLNDFDSINRDKCIKRKEVNPVTKIDDPEYFDFLLTLTPNSNNDIQFPESSLLKENILITDPNTHQKMRPHSAVTLEPAIFPASVIAPDSNAPSKKKSITTSRSAGNPDKPKFNIINNVNQPHGLKMIRPSTILPELEATPGLRIIFDIVSKFIKRSIASFKISSLLYYLRLNDAVKLSFLLTLISFHQRPDKASQIQMVKELVATNLFIMDSGKYNSVLIMKKFN